MRLKLIVNLMLILACSSVEAQTVRVSSPSQHPYRHMPNELNTIDTAADEECYTYESDTAQGEWQTCGAGGGGGWTDDGTEIRLDTSTDEVEIGSAGTISAKFAVNGDTDEIQALIQGSGTQTSNILVIEQSDGTDILTGAVGGIKVTGNVQVTQLASCDTIDTDANGIMSCGNDGGGSGGAPTTVDYLVGTADGTLSAEIVVGTTPGGELEGTWGTPTIDNTGVVLTSLTVGALLGVDSIDATGAVDMDYGSADITDHTFITDSTGDGEIVLPADSIGPAEIDSTTGAYDFGGVTSFEIPNGTGPTVDAAGEIAVDTTDDQLIHYGGAKRVIPYTFEFCRTLETPVDADDNIPFFAPVDAITVTGVYGLTQGGTSIAGTISDGTNTFEAITFDSDGASDDGSITNASFTANERMEIDFGAPTGTVNWVMWCIRYIIDAQ